MSGSRLRAGVVAALLLAGAWQLAAAGWIHAKAWLAQVLLREAWASSVRDAAVHKPWPWADTWPAARLRVPARGVDLVVLEGLSGQALAFGPGLVTTATGATLLSAHRDTHFRFLRAIVPGDRLWLQRRTGKVREYRIGELAVRHHRDPRALDGAGAHDLVLVTCWPFDALTAGGPLRLVVRARAVDTPAAAGGMLAATTGAGTR